MQPSSLRWPPPVGQLRTTTWQNSKIFQLRGFKRMRDQEVRMCLWRFTSCGGYCAFIQVGNSSDHHLPDQKSPQLALPLVPISLMIHDIQIFISYLLEISSSGMILESHLSQVKIQKIPLLTGIWLLNFLQPKGLRGRRRQACVPKDAQANTCTLDLTLQLDKLQLHSLKLTAKAPENVPSQKGNSSCNHWFSGASC